MKPKFTLNAIFVANHSTEYTEFQTKSVFNKSLRKRSLSDIREWIYFRYKYNDIELNLTAKKDNYPKNWNISQNSHDDLFFTFTDKNDSQFIDLFAKHLNKNLEKIERKERFSKNHPSPPSHNSRDAKVSL